MQKKKKSGGVAVMVGGGSSSVALFYRMCGCDDDAYHHEHAAIFQPDFGSRLSSGGTAVLTTTVNKNAHTITGSLSLSFAIQ